MTVYAGNFNSMVGIWLHDCKESDMVAFLTGTATEYRELPFLPDAMDEAVIAPSWCDLSISVLSIEQK